MKSVSKALTIAGSDSGGGAGIQADLKTFAALGVYGTSAITAVTAQNTRSVTRVLALAPSMVAAQIDAVVGDIGVDALKTGMLANAGIVILVARKIREHRLANVVVDPVMVAKGGESLLSRDAVAALRTRLLPLATLVTPNLPEAERLTGIPGNRAATLRDAARKIIDMGARAVVIKGGHRRGPATDLFYDGKKFRELRAARIVTRNTHGTGCTYSAAVTAGLARGETLERSVIEAKRYITAAIRRGFKVGPGHSPVHHFYRFWKR